MTPFFAVLKSRGFRTAMIGKWHLGFQESGYDRPLPGGPADRGFDRFFGFRASTDIPPYFYLEGDRAVAPPTATIADSPAHPERGWSPIQGEFWRGGGIAPGLELQAVLPRFTDEAVAEITTHARRRAGQPLFLYYAPTGPHTPWLPTLNPSRSGALEIQFPISNPEAGTSFAWADTAPRRLHKFDLESRFRCLGLPRGLS